MSEVKISADLSEAIEKLSEKIGIASHAIIPEYSKNIMVNGIVWCIGGLLIAILPWFILPQEVVLQRSYGSYDFRWDWAYVVARWVVCIGFSWGGGYCFFNYVENILTSKGMAINRLLNQLRR